MWPRARPPTASAPVPPHPAKVAQPRPAPFAPVPVPPHPAKVAQPRPAPFAPASVPRPHPAQTIQRAAAPPKPPPKFEGLLEPQEFVDLPDHGFIDPRRLRFAQGGVTIAFSHPADTTVFSLAEELKSGKVKPEKIPPVEIGEFAQHIWSFDTRRLLAFQMAGVPVPYVKIGPAAVLAKLGNFDFVGTRKGVRILIRFAGIHKPGRIYENPAFQTEGHDSVVAALPPTDQDMVNAGQRREFDSARRVLEVLTGPAPGGVVTYPPK